MNSVLVYDASAESWRECRECVEIVQTDDPFEVMSCLNTIEHHVNSNNLFAAGFITYEASPAFDTVFRVRSDSTLPRLWFALFQDAPMVKLPPDAVNTFSLGEWKPSIDKQGYEEAIDIIKSHIAEGETYQVNFTFRLRASFSGDAKSLFVHLAHAQPTRNGAFIETDEFALCSASPELFFLLDGTRITARPMKGTALRGRTLLQDKRNAAELQLSEKNRAENLMIVDMMRNDIGSIAETGSVNVPKLFRVERYPTVWQMTSTVAGETNASVTEIMKALFPCASITGAPKARTIEIIKELETTPREIYTGAIGFIAPGRKSQFNVAIRTVLVDKKNTTAEYGVGGGIVWSSRAEEEYVECMTKARVLTEPRPRFALFETLLLTQQEGFFLLDEHLARMKDSAEYFGFPFHTKEARDMLTPLQHQTGGSLRVKLSLSDDGTFSVETQPVSADTAAEPVRVRLAKRSLDSQSIFLYHKTTHRSMYDAARSDVPDCDDVILWNERSEITESTIANVVVESNGELFTPPVESGLLAGTLRGRLLSDGTIKERVVTIKELARCQRLYLINSLRKWRDAVLISPDELR